MRIVAYLACAVALLTATYVAFRLIVRRSYEERGRLTWPVSLLQLAFFAAFFAMPYLYVPPEWAWDWLPDGTWTRLSALIVAAVGVVLAFGTMIWFGVGRAFGVKVTALRTTGLYRYSRNPQMLGGWFMVLGVVLNEPSAYAIGWSGVWAVIGYWMVTTEEEHLRRIFGMEYDQYRQETPRYLISA
jgi:protein-S-isoprenylcysteine O-methyltransferase Ste14